MWFDLTSRMICDKVSILKTLIKLWLVVYEVNPSFLAKKHSVANACLFTFLFWQILDLACVTCLSISFVEKQTCMVCIHLCRAVLRFCACLAHSCSLMMAGPAVGRVVWASLCQVLMVEWSVVVLVGCLSRQPQYRYFYWFNLLPPLVV